MGKSWRVFLTLGTISLVVGGAFASSVAAMQFTSTDYLIDTAVVNNVGGDSSSTNYRLTSSGGEAAIGNGSSGSYRMAAGYVAQVITPAITVKTQPSGLVAYYPMDENSGTFIHDSSSNANIGSFVNTPTWATGQIGNSLTFHGSATSDYIAIGNSPQTQFTNGTIEAWVYPALKAGTMGVVTKPGSYALNIVSGKVSVYDYTTSTSCSSSSLVTGGWHHIVVTYQSGITNGTIIYIDGVQAKTCTWTPVNQTGDVTIGAEAGTPYSNYYQGSIDQVKIFNRALSSQEVIAEYNAQNAGVETGLTLTTIVPGASNTSGFDTIVLTSGSSYTLAINQDHNLQNGVYTIPSISGSIASPASWSEGTTKGLGFTLKTTNATAIPAKWSSGSSYAALPGTSTSFYTRTSTQGNSKDVLGMQLRLDVATNQASGNYSNTMTITGTANP